MRKGCLNNKGLSTCKYSMVVLEKNSLAYIYQSSVHVHVWLQLGYFEICYAFC